MYCPNCLQHRHQKKDTKKNAAPKKVVPTKILFSPIFRGEKLNFPVFPHLKFIFPFSVEFGQLSVYLRNDMVGEKESGEVQSHRSL